MGLLEKPKTTEGSDVEYLVHTLLQQQIHEKCSSAYIHDVESFGETESSLQVSLV